MCNEVPRGDLRQEIWAHQESYHHENLMVGLGENRKKMVTEIWAPEHWGWDSKNELPQLLGEFPLKARNSTGGKRSEEPRLHPRMLVYCLWEQLSKLWPPGRHRPIFFFFFFAREGEKQTARPPFWKSYKNRTLNGKKSLFHPRHVHLFIHSFVHSFIHTWSYMAVVRC